MLNQVLAKLSAFHQDERGADEGINKLMIFALIALPLIAIIAGFGKQIVSYAKTQWSTTMGSAVK